MGMDSGGTIGGRSCRKRKGVVIARVLVGFEIWE